MIPEWKVRSRLYAKLFPNPGDDLRNETVIEEWEDATILKRALDYPFVQTKELYYPAKSYAIATTYAILLSKYFGGNVRDYLSDPELLAGNDPYFKIYSEKPQVYDYLIACFLPMLKSDDGFWEYSENYNKTLDYFYKEFLLAEDTKQYAPVD